MTLAELDVYVKRILPMEAYAARDSSLNGVQMEAGIGGQELIRKIAFAVDACLDTIEQAHRAGANVLFVHHGLFWGKESPVTGRLYQLIKKMRECEIALYAVHLPLDADPLLGHNAQMANLLGLENREPLGAMGGGLFIGCSGTLPKPLSVKQIKGILEGAGKTAGHTVEWVHSPPPIQTVGLISGGGFRWWREAQEKGVDLFITGETLHQFYHEVKEAAYNTLTLGHYFTERWGMIAMADQIQKDCHVPTCFLEYETGL
jgi:dinuclear metal center YbgI/SA1388 family protein